MSERSAPATSPARREGACVLAFHRVVSEPERDHDLSLRSFRALLDRMDALATVELHEAFRAPSSVVLTFDDATVDHRLIGEELAARGLRAIFFVPGGLVGNPGRLAREDISALVSYGHEVGGHGYSHASLIDLPEGKRADELARTRLELEALTGSPLRFFAPPGGLSNCRIIAELIANSFRACRSMRWGIYRCETEAFCVPCIPVTEFTFRCGWVPSVISTARLPWSMRLAWRVKTLLPVAPRSFVRNAIHVLPARRGGLA